LVIGENMRRVQAYAKEIDANAYRPLRDNPSYAVAYARDRRMIKDAMRAEREIIDIGPDFARRRAGRDPSPFYNLERQLTRGYAGYRKVFVRYSRLSGGLPGFD
jgi:hypothetical protein